MKKSIYPKIFDEHLRPPEEITRLEDLSNYNTVLGTYRLRIGDNIVFPSSLESMYVLRQQAKNFPDESMIHVFVLRNGEPSYLSLGALHTEGLCGEHACVYSRLFANMSNDYERLKYLVNKSIYVESSRDITFALYERDRFFPLCFDYDKTPRGLLSTKAPVYRFVSI